MTLQEKIDQSIALLRKGERLALAMQPEQGYFVGFSGGKDSQVLLELVRMSGVRHHAYYSVTTNDPPENVYFIRQYYPEVTFLHPNENFFRLVAKKGLPTMMRRYCCEVLKEGAGVGNVVLTGVRRDESKKRAAYMPVQRRGRNKESAETKDLDQMEAANFECVSGKDKFMIYPILDWTEADVWAFLEQRHLPRNPCYDSGHRVGCMFCPFTNRKQIDYYTQRYPKIYTTLITHLQRYLDKKDPTRLNFTIAEEYFEWWKCKESVKAYKAKKRQLNINFN